MILPNSLVTPLDNSGVILVRCINTPSNRKNVAKLGDVITCSIRKIIRFDTNSTLVKPVKYKVGDVAYGLIVNVKKK